MDQSVTLSVPSKLQHPKMNYIKSSWGTLHYTSFNLTVLKLKGYEQMDEMKVQVYT